MRSAQQPPDGPTTRKTEPRWDGNAIPLASIVVGETRSCCRRRSNKHAGRGGFPHELNLGWGQGVGLVDEVAEGALQAQGFGGEGAGGFDGAGVFLSRSSQRAHRGNRVPHKHDILTNPFSSSISAGVRPWAWLMMSLSVRSRFRVSAARGAGRGDGAGVLVPQRVQTGGGLVSIVRTDACLTFCWTDPFMSNRPLNGLNKFQTILTMR
jgi:hypothetical protein